MKYQMFLFTHLHCCMYVTKYKVIHVTNKAIIQLQDPVLLVYFNVSESFNCYFSEIYLFSDFTVHLNFFFVMAHVNKREVVDEEY